MRSLLAALCLLGLAAGAATPVSAASLDPLFQSLAEAEQPGTARTIADRIRSIWSRIDNPDAERALRDGVTALQSQQPDAALDFLNRAVELAPEHAQARFRRAQARFALDDAEGAMKDLATALDLEPRHFDALTMVGSLYLFDGNEARAAEALRRALALHPYHRTARAQLAAAEARGEGNRL